MPSMVVTNKPDVTYGWLHGGSVDEGETSAVKAYTAGQTSMAEVMAALDKVRLQRSIQQTPTMET